MHGTGGYNSAMDLRLQPPTLPEPDAQARAASAELTARIAQRIAAAGGWIGFDAFMQAALYEPGLGYYGGATPRFGPGGDFVTAPVLSSQFGACVATQLAQWFDDAPDLARRVIEFGAGDGSLAADLLLALTEAGVPPTQYAIVELSGALRERQRATIGQRLRAQAPEQASTLIAAVHWWSELPDTIEGCIVGNELLDAMPVRLFHVLDRVLHERGVAVERATPHSEPPHAVPKLVLADRNADAAFARSVAAALDEAMPQWRDAALDYVSEWPEQASAWVADVGARLARGAMLLIDYGFPRAEFYHPQRTGGTLMAHRAHHAHTDPLAWPGQQDITAHVDFSAVADAGLSAGLALAGYTSQANFLLNTGLLDRVARVPSADAMTRARKLQAVQTLVSEAEMGELFKAIAFVRGIDARSIGFARGDRSGRL